MPRVSVVVPVHNNAAHVARTLESVLAQDFTDWELVVADHASSDGSPGVLDHFTDHPRVRLLSPTPAGGGAKRNWDRVSMAATGEFLKLLPADDLLHPRALERQVAALAESDAVLACCSRRLVDERGRLVLPRRGLPRRVRGRVDARSLLRRTVRAGGNLIGEPGAVLLRRELLETVGWWDDRDPFVIDLATWARVLLSGVHTTAWVDPEPLAAFRVGGGQWSVRLARQQGAQVRSFHARLAAEHPTVISSRDARLGDARAEASALGRRAVYTALSWRR